MEALGQISLVGVQQVSKDRDMGQCPEDAPRELKAMTNPVGLLERPVANGLHSNSSKGKLSPCLDGSEEQRRGEESVLLQGP